MFLSEATKQRLDQSHANAHFSLSQEAELDGQKNSFDCTYLHRISCAVIIVQHPMQSRNFVGAWGCPQAPSSRDLVQLKKFEENPATCQVSGKSGLVGRRRKALFQKERLVLPETSPSSKA